MSEINKNNIIESESLLDNIVDILIRQIQEGPTFQDLLRIQSSQNINKNQKIQKNFTEQINTLNKIIEKNK
jgi:hypothetical protein